MNESLVEAVRALIGFFTLLIFARLLGKQQISQLTFFDYVLGITVGSTASSLTTDLTSRALPHWVGMVTWIVCVLAMQFITLKSRYMSKYIDGEPTIVIMNGQIMEGAMRKLRYRLSDLLEQLRGKEVFDISQVQFAILEKDGALSVLKKSQYQNVTLQDINVTPQKSGVSIELIYDGKVIEQNLGEINRNKAWLDSQLKMRGINSIDEVFLAIINPQGQLYIDTYKDTAKIIDPSDYKGPN